MLAARGTQALHKDMVDPHISKTHANFWECPKPLQKYSLVVTDPKSGAPKERHAELWDCSIQLLDGDCKTTVSTRSASTWQQRKMGQCCRHPSEQVEGAERRTRVAESNSQRTQRALSSISTLRACVAKLNIILTAKLRP